MTPKNQRDQAIIMTVSQHPKSNTPPITWRARMKGVLSGGLLVAIGCWLISHGVHVVISERYRQPVFSYSAIAAGMVVILVSAAPSWLIIKMTTVKKYCLYQAGYHAHGDSITSVQTAAPSGEALKAVRIHPDHNRL